MPKSKLVGSLRRVSSSIETCGPPCWRLEGCCYRILTPVVALCSPRVEKSPPAEETAKSARDSQLRAVGLLSLSRLRRLANNTPLVATLRLNHWNLGLADVTRAPRLRVIGAADAEVSPLCL